MTRGPSLGPLRISRRPGLLPPEAQGGNECRYDGAVGDQAFWSCEALLFDLILEGPEVGYLKPGADLRTVATARLTSLAAGLNIPAARSASMSPPAQPM